MQPTAKIIETNYAKVDVAEIMNTSNFDFEEITSSAGWIKELEKEDDEDDAEYDEHEHHHEHDDEDNHEEHHHEHEHEDEDTHEHGGHHHHHHHDEGEAEEYGISTFVYSSRKPFDVQKFEKYVNEKFPKTVIRCKGLVWFKNDYDMSYLFEQAGKQFKVSESGYWLASAPKEDLEQIVANNPDALKDWDEEVGDRMVKLVFIGKDMDKKKIIEDLNELI